MSRLLNGIKSFVHSISTNDHYASYDPSRPQGLDDTAPLASSSEDRRSSSSSLGKSYVPGMRSAQMSSTNLADGSSSGRDSIPLSDMTPIPSAQLSWDRIDNWIEQNYPEMHDQLLEGATSNDLNDLEHDLDATLPKDVRQSFMVHDGQEPGAKPTGVFFGIALLDLEGIGMEWSIWRRMGLKVEELAHRAKPQASSSSTPSTGGARVSTPASIIGVPGMNLGWIDRQKCCPPDTVQQVFFHPAWIPLAKDVDGNNIAVDLAPGPKGRYGQVIFFGRDFDTKFVVAPSWGDFLAQFAADLESGQSFIDEDIDNPVFAFKAPSGQLVSYFSVLRSRIERTLPKQAAPQQQQQHQQQQQGRQQRRSMSSIPSVSNAPSNSGRVTPRLISPISSSASLPLKDTRSRPKTPQTVSGQLNEVDLNEAPAQPRAESEEPSPVRKEEAKDKKTDPELKKEAENKLDGSPEDAARTVSAEEARVQEPAKEEPTEELQKDEPKNEPTNEPKEDAGKTELEEEPKDEPENNAEDAEKESSEEPEAVRSEAEATTAEQKPSGGKSKKKNKKKGKN